MPTYEHGSHVDAPLETVWDFYSRITGLTRLTPGWLDLRVEAIRFPDGEVVRDPDVGSEPPELLAGTAVTMSAAPGGVGPRQRWTSRITERERTDDAAVFRDEMVDGPFPRWVHTHAFEREGEGTRVRDVVDYDLPGGTLGRKLAPLARVGFEPMFRYRHRRTRQLLAGDGAGAGDGDDTGTDAGDDTGTDAGEDGDGNTVTQADV